MAGSKFDQKILQILPPYRIARDQVAGAPCETPHLEHLATRVIQRRAELDAQSITSVKTQQLRRARQGDIDERNQKTTDVRNHHILRLKNTQTHDN